jgi:hypothetical protein
VTAADLRLTVDQENALRESEETGRWYPRRAADRKIAEYLVRRNLFGRGLQWASEPGYRITAAGRNWLATHPTEVAR